MSGGNRLYCVALGGCLVWLILAGLVWPSLAQEAKSPSKAAAQTEQPDAKEPEAVKSPAAAPPEQEEPPPAVEGQHGQGANYYSEADLEAQRRMAVATEELTELTGNQIVIGGIEIVLLVAAVILTAWAAIAASRAAKASAETVAAMRRSERAYVTMSHRPPGLDLLARMGFAAFEVEIKNHGRTPATVTDVLLQLDWFGEGNPAPDRPVYRTGQPRRKIGFFLVTQAHFYYSRSLPIPNKGVGEELWLYGYVDYTDEFEQDHRAGYARIYVEGGENNLLFVDRRNWNYDSPRLPNEGDRPEDDAD